MKNYINYILENDINKLLSELSDDNVPDFFKRISKEKENKNKKVITLLRDYFNYRQSEFENVKSYVDIKTFIKDDVISFTTILLKLNIRVSDSFKNSRYLKRVFDYDNITDFHKNLDKNIDSLLISINNELENKLNQDITIDEPTDIEAEQETFNSIKNDVNKFINNIYKNFVDDYNSIFS